MTVHCSAVNPVCRSAPIAGSAMLTTVASIPAMPDPRMVANSTHRPAEVPVRTAAAGSAGMAEFVTPDQFVKMTAS